MMDDMEWLVTRDLSSIDDNRVLLSMITVNEAPLICTACLIQIYTQFCSYLDIGRQRKPSMFPALLDICMNHNQHNEL